MTSNTEQFIAFLHYSFKHIFEIEFGIKILIEFIVLFIFLYILSKIIIVVFNKISKILLKLFVFLKYYFVLPYLIRFVEWYACKLGSSKWQNYANKMKQEIVDYESNNYDFNTRLSLSFPKKYLKIVIVIFCIIIIYMESIHYLFPNVRDEYPVFYLLEDNLVKLENHFTYIVLMTDETLIPCFYNFLHYR